MSFQKKANSIKSKLHLTEINQPVLIGLLSLAICIVLFAAFMLVRLSSQGDFSIALEDEMSASENLESLEDGSVDQNGESALLDKSKKTIFVHMSGEVNNPGVVELPEGSRGIDAVEAAGGFTDEAVYESLNLAREVQDGEQIIVSKKGSEMDQGLSSSSAGILSDGVASLVNLNTASIADLMSLPGVGESTAKKIVDDRDKNGPYQSKEDLKRVSGIGDKKYESLKDLICVQ